MLRWLVLPMLVFVCAGATATAAAVRDRDHDRLPDRWERKHHLSTRTPSARRDPDHDRLTNLRELRLHTHPKKADTDGDRLRDGAEVRRFHTNPRRRDTDRDGFNDGCEIRKKTSPRNRRSHPASCRKSKPPRGGPPGNSPPPSGWPNESNTGVPAGTSLTPSGGMTINTAGAVIDARDISGPVVVNAPNVTIKRSRIRSNAMWLVESNSTGLVIEDSELMNKPVSGQNNCHNTIGSGNFTVRRSEMTGCENAANIDGDNVTMTDNYIHDLDTTGPSYVWGNEPHTDGLQMSPGANNVVIRHNWIDPTAGGGATSAIIMGVNGSQSNVWIENNYLDGRNASYAIYANRSASPNVHINGNRMLRGVGGYTACVKLGNTVTTFTDNRDFTTGALLTPDNGAGNSCNN